MTTRSSVLRKASARLEALEQRSLFSGEIDHGFGDRGLLGVYDAAGWNIGATVMTTQPDGSILLAGSAHGNYKDAVVVRYRANSTLDTSFGTGGYATVKNVNANRIDGLTVLANGKIQVTGQTEFRLTSAGKLDTSYSGDGQAPSLLAGDRRGVSLSLPDGSILELGRGDPKGLDRLFKYKADGTVDKSFAVSGSFGLSTVGSAVSGGLTVDSSGRIYVSFLGKTGDVKIARLTAAGKLDATWGSSAGVANGAPAAAISQAVSVLKDGRVLVGYRVVDGTNTAQTGALDVFTSKGIDSERHTYAAAHDFVLYQITQAADGSIYLGGTYNDGRAGASNTPGNNVPLANHTVVIHLKSNLSVDTTYSADADGIGGYSVGGGDTLFVGARIAPSGDVILAGRDESTTFVARLTAASKPTGVSVKYAGGVYTVTGSSGDDSIHIGTYLGGAAGYDIVIDLDSRRGLISEDRLIIGGNSTPKITVNLNGGNDTLDASDSGVILTANGGDGDDSILGSRNENPAIHGNAGNDTIRGGYGSDSLYGDAGNDDIIGEYGDLVDGGADADYLVATYGHNTLLGGDGNDYLYHGYFDNPSVNSAVLNGGNGNDRAAYSTGDTVLNVEQKTFTV